MEWERGGALWWPRFNQGNSRHDNPQSYACIYASETQLSAVAETLARFRGTAPLDPVMLIRRGRPLAVGALEVADGAEVIDLDHPRVLAEERLRPSRVATREREVTQAYAAKLYERHPRAVAWRWWSTLESLWTNVTLLERARPKLVGAPRKLTVRDPVVVEAAEFLGLAHA